MCQIVVHSRLKLKRNGKVSWALKNLSDADAVAVPIPLERFNRKYLFKIFNSALRAA